MVEMKKIYIWGTGKYGRKVLDAVHTENCEVKGFIDNNPAKWGEFFEGVEIVSFRAISEDYDVIILGYPNWWASIPMPIASFLEEYEFEGKTIIPFCSHGGGRFGQSLTAIAKLAPESKMGEALSIHYSGDSTLEDDISEWLRTNGIEQ